MAIICDPSDPVVSAAPSQWAVQELQQGLAKRGIRVRRCERLDEADPANLCIIAAGPGSPLARDAGIQVPSDAEGLAISPAILGPRTVLVASGGGVRGLVYALTELADAASDDPVAALRPAGARSEKPSNRVRSVMRCFTSAVEDKAWLHDRDFWRRYLAMLVSQRFNRFNLSFGLGRYEFFQTGCSIPTCTSRTRSS